MMRPEKATHQTIARTRAKNRLIGGWPRIALCMGSAVVTLLAPASPQAFAASPVEVTDFGLNPGNLRMFEFLPDGLPPSAPLVVVMHGCTQNATTFANETGWIQLADKFGFALALPQQIQDPAARRVGQRPPQQGRVPLQPAFQRHHVTAHTCNLSITRRLARRPGPTGGARPSPAAAGQPAARTNPPEES